MMDNQLTLDICKRKVLKAKPGELERLNELMEERYWNEIAEKLLVIERRHEREDLRLASECEGQMEIDLC